MQSCFAKWLSGHRTLSGGPSVAHGNLVDIASATMQMSELPDFTTSTLPTEARDVRWLDANAQTTESIAPGEEDLSAPARKVSPRGTKRKRS